AQLIQAPGGGEETGGGHRIAIDANMLGSLSGDGLALLWPAFVARLGVPLDRRGVTRATTFTLSARAGQAAQCAGGIRLDRTRHAVIVTRQSPAFASATVRVGPTVEFGGWRLRRVSRAAFNSRSSQQALWGAAIDRIERCSVRTWEPGDRVQALGQSVPRRVKRYFRELAIPVGERQNWPVVVADGQVLWVPGVCLSAAAVEHLGGRPTYLMCERRAG
ncbi:MAG: tRNA lysidine(34) synthetase TilS, partial [Gemmatimonadaceae bacterium]